MTSETTERLLASKTSFPTAFIAMTITIPGPKKDEDKE